MYLSNIKIHVMYAFNIKNPSIILVTCETFKITKKLKLSIFMCINVYIFVNPNNQYCWVK